MRTDLVVLVSLVVVTMVSGCAPKASETRVSVTRGIAYGKDAQQTFDAYLPTGRKSDRPALIWVHGGYWHSNADAAGMEKWCRHWASDMGYPSFNVRYRLSPEHHYPDAAQDVLLAARYVQSRSREYGIEPSRVVLIGVSAGGHLALLAAMADPGSLLPGKDVPIKGVISFAGPTDLLKLSKTGGRARTMISEFIGGPADSMQAKCRDASPISHVSKNDPPVLLIHGTSDQTIPFAQSLDLQKKLMAAGVPCTLFSVQGGLHGAGFDSPSNSGIAGRMVDYLKSIGCGP